MRKITEIPKNDKPREKLAKKGVEALSSKELLMVMLGKGIKGKDVVELANVIEQRTVFKGTINYSVVHPREIFSDALTDRAAGIIFVHNHPENNVEPSEADKKITKQLCDAAKLLGIQVIDHIIVTKNQHFSFQSEQISCQLLR